MIFSMLARCCTHIAHEKLNTRIVIWRTWTFVCLLAGTQAYTHIANSMFLARTAIAFRPDLMHVELEEKETAPSTQRRPISSNNNTNTHTNTRSKETHTQHTTDHISVYVLPGRGESRNWTWEKRKQQTHKHQNPYTRSLYLARAFYCLSTYIICPSIKLNSLTKRTVSPHLHKQFSLYGCQKCKWIIWFIYFSVFPNIFPDRIRQLPFR